MSKIKNAARILFLPLNALNRILPKREKIFIYSNLGFRDNTRAIYEHLVTKGFNKNYKITVSCPEFKKYKNNAPENVNFKSNLGGIFSFLTSKYSFYSFGKYPIKPYNQKVVNLWHGMPLKKIGNMEDGKENIDQNFFTHLIATSPFFSDIMKKCFNAKDENIIITNQPRTDEFLKPPVSEFENTVVWLPTFKKSKKLSQTDGETIFSIFNNDSLSKINEALLNNNLCLILKPHPMEDVSVIENNYSNIKIINDEWLEEKKINLYSLLNSSKALITDYSSVFFDYMMLGKPIAFTISDINAYMKNRGFVTENPEELMVGFKIKIDDDFCAFINSLNGPDEYKAQRSKINKMLNINKKYNGCQTILDAVGIKSEE